MKKAVVLLIAVVVSLVFTGGCEKKGAEKNGEKPKDAASVRKAPDFTLQTFDGKQIKLSDYAGKIVVLEWFSNQCPFSKYHHETANTMVTLAGRYKEKNVVWLAINSTNQATAQENMDYAKEHGISYPILDDRAGTVGRAYGAKTTPHMFVIDTRGNIVYDGAIDNAPMGKTTEGMVNYIDKALEELTSGKSVSIPTAKPYGCSVKYAQQ